jgi:CDI immunity proteins
MRISDIDRSLSSRPKLDSGVSVRAHALAERHLEELTLGDIAFCLRQGIAVPEVIVRAFDALAAQPLIEAELYPGDLLSAAIHAEEKGWLHADQRGQLREICSSAVAGGSTLATDVLPLAQSLIRRHDAT